MSVLQPQLVDVLMGCAVGHVLVAPLEGRLREEIAKHTDLMTRVHLFRSFSAGHYTDDA